MAYYLYKALRDCTVRDNFHFEGEVFSSPVEIRRTCVQLLQGPKADPKAATADMKG